MSLQTILADPCSSAELMGQQGLSTWADLQLKIRSGADGEEADEIDAVRLSSLKELRDVALRAADPGRGLQQCPHIWDKTHEF